ncbi:MAG: Cell cycle serine/threonine-protein kinase cdc5/MSD2 [Piccolia ochrophora]|nr:MAG: Cell cycle serine/threonine-protein kinase cdc5/MSD2 [Piccolia ochrophora]
MATPNAMDYMVAVVVPTAGLAGVSPPARPELLYGTNAYFEACMQTFLSAAPFLLGEAKEVPEDEDEGEESDDSEPEDELYNPTDDDDMEPLSPRSANLPVASHQRRKEAGVGAGFKVAVTRRFRHERPEQIPVADPVSKTERKTLRTQSNGAKKVETHPDEPPEIVYEPLDAKPGKGRKYRHQSYLGKGGFAKCYEYKYIDEASAREQRYALKVVRTTMPHAKMAEKFKTELQIHSKMRHPNIVEFHRAFTYLDNTYIVLELCTNASMMEMVKRRRMLTDEEIRRYTIQTCGAIKYMHDKGVVHRDLKMGNLFLDENMNVKVGDFGLAALLVSDKEYRRMTLCGTPNYIAPEILERGKRGHDQKVDIWSLGVIIFAQLTGKPPFQSSTQAEIYRKVQDREYEWPIGANGVNLVSAEAQDLVNGIFAGDPEDRPEPDQIVSHPFIRNGNVPLSIPSEARYQKPSFPRQTTNTQSSWAIICSQSGVGYRDSSTSVINTFPVVGEEVGISTYKQCAKEASVGLAPVVPIPIDAVYRPFRVASKTGFTQPERPKVTYVANETARLPVHPKAKSHASTIRESVMKMTGSSRSHGVGYGLLSEEPVRPQGPIVSSRVTRSQSVTGPYLQTGNEAAAARVSGIRGAHHAREDSRRKELQDSIRGPLPQRPRSTVEGAPQQKFQKAPIDPMEIAAPVAGTAWHEVSTSLSQLQTNLDIALNQSGINPASLSIPKRKYLHTFVEKWVDYTNKFGVGYVLNDGSIGCLFKSESGVPSTSIMVRGARDHVRMRELRTYTERKQIVPVKQGAPIEFFESRGEGGLQRVLVEPRKFALKIEGKTMSESVGRGKDKTEEGQIKMVITWRKFSNYLIEAMEDKALTVIEQFEKSGCGPVVKFYQRLGDVGVWAFADGAFQFNFPDHTKVILSDDGIHCDFFYLPVDVAGHLDKYGSFDDPNALSNRGRLSLPTRQLFRQGKGDTQITAIVESNQLAKKICFVKQVVAEWQLCGGLGGMRQGNEKLEYKGMREKPKQGQREKLVWATVGCHFGDSRQSS